MFKPLLIVVVAIATSLTFAADYADAFGGRGYARRHARRAYHHAHYYKHHVYRAPVVVHRAPIVSYHAPVVRYYSAAPVYHHPVSVSVGPYYRPAYHSYYGGGVSVRVGW